jgi:hypothetical protein
MKLLVSISGLPKVGKTTLAHSFPNALHLDFTRVSMSFRKLKVHEEEYGEGYDPIRKLYNNDKEFEEHYKYVNEWEEVYPLLKGKETIVIDDSYRARGLCTQSLMKRKRIDFPSQQDWGAITQELDALMLDVKSRANIVVINQMSKRIEKIGDSIIQYVEPRYLPNDLAYMADISITLKLDMDKKDKKIKRVAYIDNNRFLDPAGDEWVEKVEDPTYLSLLALLKVPKRYY